MTYEKTFQTAYAEMKNLWAGENFLDNHDRRVYWIALKEATGTSYRWVNLYLKHIDDEA